MHLGRAADPHLHDALPCLFDGPGRRTARASTRCRRQASATRSASTTPCASCSPATSTARPTLTRTAAIVERAGRLLPSLGREVVDELVCCWTDSPDGWFVVDQVGSVVVACGDSGKGFKYAPAIGEILADLAEGGDPDPDVAAMSARRFEGLRS